MAALLKYLFNVTYTTISENQDPRVQHWPLIGSPLPMTATIAVYLTFVLYLGPKFMKNREPYDLKYIMRGYNAIQVVANTVIFIYGIRNSYLRKEFSWTCQPIDHNNNEPWMYRLLLCTYGYYLTKYLDLFDTVFIILRKKYNQITFLHVYHHAGMVFCVYLFMTFMAGSHSTMLGVVNLFVHIIMYSYYFASSVRPVAESIWWKRHITQLQLAQFGYLMLHFVFPIVWNHCGHPLLIAFIGLTQNAFMFALFFDFYYNTYVKPSKQAQKQQEQLIENNEIKQKQK